MPDRGRTPYRELEISNTPPGTPGRQHERLPPVGQQGLATLGLALGMLLVAIQLWLLTVAFDLYLAGEQAKTLGAAIASGLVFLGGLGMLRLLDRTPRQRR